MWTSLGKLAALPPETKVYCGHEYTLANARFALTVDPDNADLAARARKIEEARERGEPTVPTTIGEELATNPFLRADSAPIRQHLAMRDDPPAAVFAEIRRRKDLA
jgi:hydroxyacylglutathione hydrolase